MLLEEVSKDKNNNLNFIRFIAAIMVIWGHSYPLSGGKTDWLNRLTAGQASLGGWAVCIFFFFSGFWLCRSVQKNPTFCGYFKARCTRIFPALIVVVFFSTFILGSFATTLSLQEYFSDIRTYEYLLNSVLIIRHNLPGVFGRNVYGSVVNGSLWTLPVEFLCYIACYLTWRIGLLTDKKLKYTVPLFIVGYILASALSERFPLFFRILRPCGMFYLGMFYNVYRKYIRIKPSIIFFCILGLFISARIRLLRYNIIFLMPHILIWLSFGTKRKLSGFGKNWELSYGMYLCAFPIQQTVAMLFGGTMKAASNFLVSMPFILLSAFCLHIFMYRRTFYAKSRDIDRHTCL